MNAQFVNSQYQAFLARNKKGKKKIEPVPAKAPVQKVKAAEKRAEMRKKG